MPLLAISELCASRTDASVEVTAEGVELTRQLKYEQDEVTYVALQAWTASLIGDEEACRGYSASAIQRGLAAGLGWAVGEAHLALGLLELGLGNARAAIDHLEQTDPGPFPPTMVLATPELIDAALRLGEPDRARRALKRLEAWAPVSHTAFVAGMVARCRGVMSSDAEEAELCFQKALRHHDYRVQPYERARTQLAYGERLRRDRRRIDARIQLRAALDTFEGIGVRLWAERTRGELRATGETARRREASTLDELTPQELRVARLVASGASNKDVAAAAVRQPQDRRVSPREGVRQARHQLTGSACACRAGTRWRARFGHGFSPSIGPGCRACGGLLTGPHPGGGQKPRRGSRVRVGVEPPPRGVSLDRRPTRIGRP